MRGGEHTRIGERDGARIGEHEARVATEREHRGARERERARVSKRELSVSASDERGVVDERDGTSTASLEACLLVGGKTRTRGGARVGRRIEARVQAPYVAVASSGGASRVASVQTLAVRAVDHRHAWRWRTHAHAQAHRRGGRELARASALRHPCDAARSHASNRQDR